MSLQKGGSARWITISPRMKSGCDSESQIAGMSENTESGRPSFGRILHVGGSSFPSIFFPITFVNLLQCDL